MHTRTALILAALTCVASASAEPAPEASFTPVDCTANPGDPYCTRADQWNVQMPETGLNVEKTCAAVTEILEGKTKNAQWQNLNCRGPAKDPLLAAKLSPEQANACRMWFAAQAGTLRDLCIARDDTIKTQKNLLFLAGTNAAAAILCRLEYNVMLRAAKSAGQAIDAAKTGKKGNMATSGVSKYLLGAKTKPLVCMISAFANVGVEAVIAKSLYDINKSNYLSMGQSVHSGKLDSAKFGDPQQSVKTLATLAGMGINVRVLERALHILTTRGLCTTADLTAVSANASTATSAQQKRCKATIDQARIEQEVVGTLWTPRGPRRRIASELEVDEVRLKYQTSEADFRFIYLLSELGNLSGAHDSRLDDSISLGIIDLISRDLMDRAGA